MRVVFVELEYIYIMDDSSAMWFLPQSIYCTNTATSIIDWQMVSP